MLAAGVPLFLCMPPWNDVTLYDVAARNILRGGVHYRDVFDTNLPGMPWLMAATRALFGRSYEALRAVDLVVTGAAVGVLCVWVRRCGGTGYAAGWFAAAAALFYPFQSEFTHVQRDPWMLLPAVVAARLRLRRVGRAEQAPSHGAVVEGFIWGVAVWLKPHVVFPALAVWAVSAVLLARREPRRRVLADLGGLVLGGLLAGAPGVVWLVASGAWPHFRDVFLNWNPAYLAAEGESLVTRFGVVFWCFRPWSLLQFVAVPLAVLALWEARAWSRRGGEPARVFGSPRWYLAAETEQVANARALLAALFLGWLAQAVLLQRGFDYVHTPLAFLGMAVIAGYRWCFGFAYLVWFVLAGAVVNVEEHCPAVAPAIGVVTRSPVEQLALRLGDHPDAAAAVRALDPVPKSVKLEKHPLFDANVMKLWPRCWTEGSSPELRDRLGQYTDVHCGTRWQELDAVAAYLRTVDPPLRDGELNCWHDSTHPLYLTLDLKPATRFMHYGTVFGIAAKRADVESEVRASRHRYVVSDLLRTTWNRDAVYRPESWRAGDPLPVWLPPAERARYPWNQPVVFRRGRYVVHRIIDPNILPGPVRVPDWDKLDQLHRPDE